MKYAGAIIRPPSEAHSLLLQATVGCSHNRCTFCPSFKNKKFRIKTFEEVEEDIREAGAAFRSVRRIFLCDGDALIMPQRKLLPVLQAVNRSIRGVERIGTYANAKSILRKSAEELAELRSEGLKIVYMGLETGNEELLRKIRKGVNAKQMVEAGRRVKEVGIDLSVTVLLGIGGKDGSTAHALDTARVLTDIDPDYAGVLTVMIVPGTPLHEEHEKGDFVLPGHFELLGELRAMVEASRFSDCFFTSNHASNYLPIRARLPGEKDAVLGLIDRVIGRGDLRLLRPEFMRGL